MTLNERIEAGLLTRRAWKDTDAEGRERLCLLAALSPEAAERKMASACPARVMPAWLAYLTPRIDDHGTVAAWPAMVRRYADVAARWHVLSADDWEDARRAFLVAVLDEAAKHLSGSALAANARVRQWLADDEPEDEWDEVRRIAAAARAAAAYAAARAAASASASAAWDRMTDALLSDLEKRCDERERA